MDDPEHDKPPPELEPLPDNGGELELEPPIETLTHRQRQPAHNPSLERVDIEDIYEDAERDRGGEILEGWLRNFRFQFQLKHLLIATAVLAIILTLIKLKLFWTTLIVGTMLSVAGLYFYLQWEEKKHAVEADRKRQALYARRRAQTTNAEEPAADEVVTPIEVAPLPVDPVVEARREAMKEQASHFQFSLREMLTLMTAAAVSLALVRLLGGPAATTSVLGLVALGGLVIYAFGYEPPHNMILVWWLILVMYVLISIGTAVLSAFA